MTTGSPISAAAHALAIGDALGALKQVALLNEPEALALRGIAMAQLGEYARARALLMRAARSFGAHQKLAKARCVVAEAEVALAERDIGGSSRSLTAAIATLDAYGDYANARQADLVIVRRLLLLGLLADARAALALIDIHRLPPAVSAVAELARTELALRSLCIGTAVTSLASAHEAAVLAKVPALMAEVEHARAAFIQPAARRLFAGGEQTLCVEEVAGLLASGALVMDACRRGVAVGTQWYPLARRPVLFRLANRLAQAWPGDISREALIAQAFCTRYCDDTLRARLRVEISRLRAKIADVACIDATEQGFALRPLGNRGVVVLAPPADDDQASLVALLADGAAWSTSALALAMGESQRTVQRALVELEASGQVRAIGRARTHRWLSRPLTGFTTILLLPVVRPTE